MDFDDVLREEHQRALAEEAASNAAFTERVRRHLEAVKEQNIAKFGKPFPDKPDRKPWFAGNSPLTLPPAEKAAAPDGTAGNREIRSALISGLTNRNALGQIHKIKQGEKK